MTRVSDGTNVPISPAPASSSNMGSPDGSLPDLEGTGFRACTMEEKINEVYSHFPLFRQNAVRIENCVQTLAQTVAAQTTKITNIEQIVGSLVARVTSLETNAASGSESPDSTSVVAQSRPARNLVASAPARSLPQSSSVLVLRSPRRPGVRCPRSEPYFHVMQVERNERLSLGRSGGPTSRRRDLSLTFQIRMRIGYLKRKFSRIYNRNLVYLKILSTNSL